MSPSKIVRIPGPGRILRPFLPAVLQAALACTVLAEPGSSPAPRRADGFRAPVSPDIAAYDPDPPLKGDLYIGGGFTFTLLEQWAAILERAHPNVKVHIVGYGSTAAFGEMVEGVTQVCLLTREFLPFEEEFMQIKMQTIRRLGIEVATGGYSSDRPECVPSEVIMVNKDNPIKGLTVAQLDAIFSQTRKRGYKEDITTWGQLGLSGDWADKPVHVYAPKMPDGVPNFFIIHVMQGGTFKDSNLSLYDNPGALRKDRYAIALGNRGKGSPPSRSHPLGEDRDPEAKIVPLAKTDAGPFTTGSFEDVLNRTYPLSRLIYLYTAIPDGKKIDPLAKEFIRVALSHEGQWEVARTDLMPLPAKIVVNSLKKLEDADKAKGPL